MRAIRLQTEYLYNPIGLGIRTPRFYWNCQGGKKQTAYRIVASRSGETVWDSGKVPSASMTHILYEGKPLSSRDRVNWSVQLWDEQDIPGETSEAFFEMGLLEAQDWTAKWIAGNYKPKRNTRYPVDCFRKVFSCKTPVTRARLYITACGLYEASLNGQRIGKFQLAPGSTDYRKRLQYQTYDVTELLKAQNTLKISLTDGWYRGSIGCFGPTNVFGRQTKLLCQLEITDTDARKETIISDESWDWSNDGSIRFADLKDGEVIDAGKKPTYGGKTVLTKIKGIPTPTTSDNVFPTIHEQFPAKLLTTPSGKKVLDFGQNLAGFVRFRIHGKPGQRIRLLLGETLNENGEFTQSNMQERKPVKEIGQLATVLLITGNGGRIRGKKQPTPMQEILFTCSGGEDQYQTRFSIFGFRYALIETDVPFDPADFKALAVYSDMEQTGDFSCSNEKVNRLFQNTLWSMKSNFLDVPTDCPTRERLGWTGDAQIFFDTGAYLMNTAAFFRKWLRDVKDGQFKNGKLSAVVPYNGASMLYDNTGSSVGWGDCAVLLPYRYWKRYGDDRVLREFYGVMRGYAIYMIANTGQKDKKSAKANAYNKYTYEKGVQLGEWLEPEEFQDKISAGKTVLHTEEATAYLHYTMSHMVEVAEHLDKPEDAALFREYADGARQAYQQLFLKNGAPKTDRQAKLVRPLAFGLADDEIKNTMENRLAQAVERRNYRIGTGFLSTPFVLGVLTKMGRADLAYRMLENEKAPGWLYEVNQGATTIWENWEGTASLNHYSPGAVCGWLFDTVCGIRPDGENHFIIAPVPGGSLTHARAVYRSLYGEVKSGWKKEGGKVVFSVSIPSNCTAEILLPDGTSQTVAAGDQVFSMDGES